MKKFVLTNAEHFDLYSSDKELPEISTILYGKLKDAGFNLNEPIKHWEDPTTLNQIFTQKG